MTNRRANLTAGAVLHTLLLTPGKDRYWEIDAARGCAVIMMVVFHIAFDLFYFDLADVAILTGPFRLLAVATASLFLAIAGISVQIALSRPRDPRAQVRAEKKTVIRGATIFAYGLIITVATSVYPGEGVIVFGILHLIGCCVMLSPIFIRLGKGTFIAGVVLLVAGTALEGVHGAHWLIPLGIHPEWFWSLDYTPFIPWAGIFLVGMYIGSVLYPCGNRRYSVMNPLPAFQVLSVPGRHSLAIYLLHQPIIIGLLFLFFLRG
jgi:uncharacterized membrane protein